MHLYDTKLDLKKKVGHFDLKLVINLLYLISESSCDKYISFLDN